MGYTRQSKIGNRWVRLTNFQNDHVLDPAKYDSAFPNRTVNTIEYAEMLEMGWDKPRAVTTLQDYLSLNRKEDYAIQETTPIQTK